jgi:hypothetical protein
MPAGYSYYYITMLRLVDSSGEASIERLLLHGRTDAVDSILSEERHNEVGGSRFLPHIDTLKPARRSLPQQEGLGENGGHRNYVAQNRRHLSSDQPHQETISATAYSFRNTSCCNSSLGEIRVVLGS